MARKIKVDLTNVEEFVKAEEGQHKAVVDSVELKESSNGNEMIVVKFKITAGASKGAVVYNNYVLTEKALWRLKMFLGAIGMKNTGKLAIDLDALEGKECTIEVKHEEYNGSVRARVEEVYPKGAGSSKAEDDEDEDDDDDWEE